MKIVLVNGKVVAKYTDEVKGIGHMHPEATQILQLPNNVEVDLTFGTYNNIATPEEQAEYDSHVASLPKDLEEVTLDQALNYIDNHIDAIGSLADAKIELKRILKNMATFILKD